MTHAEILGWLLDPDAARLEALWRAADRVRQANVGPAVHLRGLVEISNHCARRCAYCGLRADRADLVRYRMTPEEIHACALRAVAFGHGTVVLQAGEDPGLAADVVADIVRRIKRATPLAVTLSLGERAEADWRLWKEAGADRCLVRFETSNRRLYDAIHPPLAGQRSDRFALLRRLREIGYAIGSGVMIGIPGQTFADLARDVECFRELNLDMIGVGPFIPHPETPLGETRMTDDGWRTTENGRATPDDRDQKTEDGRRTEDGGQKAEGGNQKSKLENRNSKMDQVPATELMAYKMIALARLVCPRANIPSTTALATLNPERGRELGLERGANIVMPNLTPLQYRALYEIYPAKACIREDGDQCNACLRARLAAIGRPVGAGRGDAAGA